VAFGCSRVSVAGDGDLGFVQGIGQMRTRSCAGLGAIHWPVYFQKRMGQKRFLGEIIPLVAAGYGTGGVMPYWGGGEPDRVRGLGVAVLETSWIQMANRSVEVRRALRIALQGIRIRFGRVAGDRVGVVLGIAFLMTT